MAAATRLAISAGVSPSVSTMESAGVAWAAAYRLR